MSAEIEALRQRILAADADGTDPYEDVRALMAIDPIFDIGIAALLRTTMDVVRHKQQRTAVLNELRYEAIAA